MREKADSELVRRQNRQLVLQTLRQRGPLARIELGRFTGLSPASITSISGQLIEEGLVQELAEPIAALEPARRGRPMVRLDLNPLAAQLVAVKLSIDGIELALADYRGQVVARALQPPLSPDTEAGAFGQAIAAEIKAFLAARRVPVRQVRRIAIAVQGLADSQAGAWVWSPAFRARNIPVCQPIATALGIDCTIANDANMIAEGLIGLDPRRYGGSSAVIFIGYGVGMGLILNGTVYHGTTGAAAEFGHMNHLPDGPLCRCGRRGCVEAFVADYGVMRSATSPAGDAPAGAAPVPAEVMRLLEEAALRSDGPERRAFAQAGEALGYGIARLIALLSPEHVVLAGPGTRAMALIEPALHAALEAGVVSELRRNTDLSVVPIDTDMIIKGTIDTSLRALDRDLLMQGQGEPRSLHKEHVA